MDLQTLGTLATQLGLNAGLVVFFVWVSWKREERLTAQVKTLETAQRETLVELVSSHNAAMISQTQTAHELVDSVRESNREVSILITRMVERPCLIKKEGE